MDHKGVQAESEPAFEIAHKLFKRHIGCRHHVADIKVVCRLVYNHLDLMSQTFVLPDLSIRSRV